MTSNRRRERDLAELARLMKQPPRQRPVPEPPPLHVIGRQANRQRRDRAEATTR